MHFGQLALRLALLTGPVLLTLPAEAQDAPMSRSIHVADWAEQDFKPYLSILGFLVFATLFKTFYPKLPYLADIVPQSLILILIGVVFSAILTALSVPVENSILVLTPQLFFNFLLPPIVLESAYSLSNRTFGDFLASIIIYAVVGTLLNFLLIGPIMYGLQSVGAMEPGLVNISLKNHFLFSSLIVAIDPVAVLAIFQETGVNLGLYYTVFGESLLNDAVTVVLYEIMREFAVAKSITGEEIGLGIASFFTISLGGLVIGLAFGVLSCILTRWESHYEAIFLILAAYISYFLANCVGWSGIIAMINCGLLQASYAFHNLSATSVTALSGITKQVAEVSEAAIFFLLGFQTLIRPLQWSWGFCLWAFVVCSFARTVTVLLLAWIINFFRINNVVIPFREQIIMIYGGLRGAVAYSLAFLLEDLNDVAEEVKRIFITTTLFIILITVGLQGLTMKPLVRLARIKLDQQEQLSIFKNLTSRVIEHVLAGIETIVGAVGRNRLHEAIVHIDNKFVRRVLQRHPESHDEKVVHTYEQIALNLHWATVKPQSSDKYLHDLPLAVVEKFLHADVTSERDEEGDNEVDSEAVPMETRVRKIYRPWSSIAVDKVDAIPEWVRPTSRIPDLRLRQKDAFTERYLNVLQRKSVDLTHREAKAPKAHEPHRSHFSAKDK